MKGLLTRYISIVIVYGLTNSFLEYEFSLNFYIVLIPFCVYLILIMINPEKNIVEIIFEGIFELLCLLEFSIDVIQQMIYEPNSGLGIGIVFFSLPLFIINTIFLIFSLKKYIRQKHN